MIRRSRFKHLLLAEISMLRPLLIAIAITLPSVVGCHSAGESLVPEGSDATIPGWVGTAVSGEQPRSDRPLPGKIVNGDIVEGDGLLWFIWENTKSRIWMPYAGSNGYLADLAQGPDATGTLVGVTADSPENRWEIAVRTGDDTRSIQQVFLVDRSAGVKFPILHKVLSAVEARGIPTAYENQYYPALPV